MSALERGTEQWLRAAVDSAPSGLLMADQAGRIVLVNREVERMFGYDRAELMGLPVDILVPERFRRHHPGFRAGFQADPHTRAMGAGRDLYGLRKDGTEIPLEIGLNPVVTDEGAFVLSSIVDISERKRAEAERLRLEEHLRQAQKMEAVGTLAGGIAHDFNNILGAIMGYSELLLHAGADPSARRDLEEILQFCRRGKGLVERILAFSRRQDPSRRPVDVQQPLEEVTRLLEATINPGIRIRTRLGGDVPHVMANPAALHQVLMNLGMNAVQAMPAGGELEFSVDSTYVTDSVARAHPRLREGPHVVLEVKDTGGGMPSHVKERAFEPFFTTKPPGEGTGLGLSVVHGIVVEHGGAVDIVSAPGEGTTVRCFLPALEKEQTEGPVAGTAYPKGNGERILYVDDEPGLAAVGGRRLALLGFLPETFTDPRMALERIEADPARYDLVITDYLMPLMSGLQLSRAVRAARADLPILLLTGHMEDLPVEALHASGIARLVKKPAQMEDLALAILDVLGGEDPGRPTDPEEPSPARG